jgi:hypothetical protein
MCARQVVLPTSLKSSHPAQLLSRQHSAPVSPLPAILTDLPASVANKRLTPKLNPLDSTLTKNRGVGVALQLSTFLPFNVQTCNSFSVTSLAAPTLQPQSNHILTITMGEGGPQPSNGFLPRCRRPLAFSHPMYSICPEQGWDRVANRRSQFTIP